jgi:hypothetical protein
MPDATLTDILGASGILLRYDASDSAKLWQDTAGTTPVTDGTTVRRWEPSSPSTLTAALTEATNGPTYRVNYSSTGYAGVQFDGTNDVLSSASTGLTAVRTHVVCVVTPLGTGRVWNRGNNTTHFHSLYQNSSTSMMVQYNLGSVIQTLNPPTFTGRVITTFSPGTGQNNLEISGAGAGDRGAMGISGSTTADLTLGSLLSGGSFSQFGPTVIHDLLLITGEVERGQVIRAAKLIATKWGISDPNATPQTAAGGLVSVRHMSGGMAS